MKTETRKKHSSAKLFLKEIQTSYSKGLLALKKREKWRRTFGGESLGQGREPINIQKSSLLERNGQGSMLVSGGVSNTGKLVGKECHSIGEGIREKGPW